MPLTASQKAYINQSFVGLRNAILLQLQLADFSHDRLATEYLVTTKVIEELLQHHAGRVEAERKTRELFNLISVGSGQRRTAPAGIRSGRIDAIVFSSTNKLIPEFFAEMKIRVTSLGSVKKDLERIAKLIRVLDPSTTPQLLGASVFPFTAEGNTLLEIKCKVLKFVLEMKKQVRAFNAVQPGVVVRLHLDKIALFTPQPDEICFEDGSCVQAGLQPGYSTIGVAVSVARN